MKRSVFLSWEWPKCDQLSIDKSFLRFGLSPSQMVFNYQPGDTYACVADIGWITGHTYVVYGPLSNGATTVLFESTPTYPDPGRWPCRR